MSKRLIAIIGICILAAAALVGYKFTPALITFIYSTPVEAKLELIDVHSVLPKNRILMDSLTQVSPDQKYTAFVTAKDKGFTDSTLWVTDNHGNLTKIDFQIEAHTFYSAIAWNKDSTKFAYLRIYPTAIVTVDITKDFYRTVILTKEKELDKNMLNPSIGYQGRGYLKWNDDDTVEFENNFSVPAKIYTVDANTKEVKFKQDVDNWEPTQTVSLQTLENTSFFSQRDPTWQAEQLGTCEDETIGKSGCAVSAIAMALTNLGIENLTPESLNKKMTHENGFVDGCDVAWYVAASFYPNIRFKGAYSGVDYNRLDYELSLGHEVVIGYKRVEFTGIPHWVVVRKKENGKYFISDPWLLQQDENHTLHDLGDKFDNMVVYIRTTEN